MDMIRVVYVSAVARDVTASEIERIVEHSRAANQRRGITGMLLHHNGSIIQALEGPAQEVYCLMDRIEEDPRHTSCLRLITEPMGTREFGDWSMGLIEASSLGSTERDIVSDGLGAIGGSEPSRAQTLLRSFVKGAR